MISSNLRAIAVCSSSCLRYMLEQRDFLGIPKREAQVYSRNIIGIYLPGSLYCMIFLVYSWREHQVHLRAALGALSWRATQSAPWLCARVSFLQGCFKSATIEDITQTNKLIRMQRAHSSDQIHFASNIQRPMLLTYHDSSYACRRDGSSQGGMLTMFVDADVLHGKASTFSPVAWQSRRVS